MRIPLLVQAFSSRSNAKTIWRVARRTESDKIRTEKSRKFSTSALFPQKDPAQLLAEADVHCLPIGVVSKEYVLVEGGTDYLTVEKHPQIQWARVWVTCDCLHGSAVNNLALGDVWPVCDKLVDKALEDVDGTAHGRVPLHGLAPWVLAGIEALAADKDHPIVPFLRDLSENDVNNLSAIAEGEYHDDFFYDDDAQKHWEELALLFLQHSPPPECILFVKKGATLLQIEHRTDPTEDGALSGGAVALYRFPEKLASWEIEDMETLKEMKEAGYKEDEFDGEDYFNDDEDFTHKENHESFESDGDEDYNYEEEIDDRYGDDDDCDFHSEENKVIRDYGNDEDDAETKS
jgi:hypothetical protein